MILPVAVRGAKVERRRRHGRACTSWAL